MKKVIFLLGIVGLTSVALSAQDTTRNPQKRHHKTENRRDQHWNNQYWESDTSRRNQSDKMNRKEGAMDRNMEDSLSQKGKGRQR